MEPFASTQKRGGRESFNQAWKKQGEPQPHAHADRKSQENRHAPQARKRGLVDMPRIPRRKNPASAGCQTAHLPRSHERHKQRKREQTKKQGSH